jgi:predicted DNA-binding protein (UPF0251 family)
VARPIKWRRIEQIPPVQSFVPADDKGDTRVNTLKLEEVEALRLKDLEGLEQEECAARMAVSRPTFQRILLKARSKVADSLINGKGIRIEGGNFTLSACPARCLDCGAEWRQPNPLDPDETVGALICPECQSAHVVCGRGRRAMCRNRCRRGGPFRDISDD